MNCFAVRLLTNRLRGKPEPLIDHNAMNQFRWSTDIKPIDIREIFDEMPEWDPSKEIEGLRVVLCKRRKELRQIFQNYAQDDNSDNSTTLMNMMEYMNFVKDSKIVSRKFPLKIPVGVFDQAVRRIVAATRIQRWYRWTSLDDKHTSITFNVPMRKGFPSMQVSEELNRFDFLGIIVKLAFLRQNDSTLGGRHESFMEILAANTRQLQTTSFRTQIRSEAFYHIFEKYRWHLRHIFVYFAAQIPNSASLNSMDETMNLEEWSTMLRCIRLLEPDGPITHDDMKTIFSNTRTGDYDLLTTADGEEAALTYPEFLEAIVILACFRYSDPYESVKERFQKFIMEDFFVNCFRWINSPAGMQMINKAESKRATKSLQHSRTILKKSKSKKLFGIRSPKIKASAGKKKSIDKINLG